MSRPNQAYPPPATVEADVIAVDAVEALYVPKELWFAAFAAAVLGYLFFSENGAVLSEHWTLLHEFFHDGRHVFGVPCH